MATLTPSGVHAAMSVDVAINGDVFAAYLDQVLGPTLVTGDVVVSDNLPAHKVAGLAELMAARSTRLVYLPLYSSGFNTTERASRKLKTGLRTAQVHTRETLGAVIQDTSYWITERDAKKWFDHCGYHAH